MTDDEFKFLCELSL